MKLCTEILTHLSLYKKAYHAVFLPVCTKYSLTQIEADILLFLNNNPEYNTATSISSICGLSKPNISTALERLRQRNLLLVEKDANSRRTNRLTLLEEGEHIAEELRKCQKDYFSRMLYGIPDDTLQTVLNFFQQTNENISHIIEQEKQDKKGGNRNVV